jgi:hypothetical protein
MATDVSCLKMMKRPSAFRCLTLVASLGLAACFCSDLVAQDVAITNVRIITVTGPVIESGTIIVRGGKIVSATAGSTSTAGLKVIDGKGMTAMPGYIDAHKHVDKFNKDQAESVLEAGYTTVLSGGGTAEDNLKLAKNIDSGVFNGPHIIPSASLPVVARDFRTVLEKGTLVGLTPEAARAAIRDMAAKGIKHTGDPKEYRAARTIRRFQSLTFCLQPRRSHRRVFCSNRRLFLGQSQDSPESLLEAVVCIRQKLGVRPLDRRRVSLDRSHLYSKPRRCTCLEAVLSL